MERHVTDRLLVPIANEQDAEQTCESIRRYFGTDSDALPTIVVVHVIEKGGGFIDKAPLEMRKEQAQEVFDVATDVLEPAGYTVETELLYGTDVLETILESVPETDTSAIAFLPREGGLLVQFLTGNLAKELVTESTVPVLTFPTKTA